MAITREQTASDSENGSTTINVTFTSTPTAGNLLVVVVSGGTAMDSWPSDWILVYEELLGKHQMWAKIAGSSESNDYVWGMPSSDQAVWAAAEYSSTVGWSAISPMQGVSAASTTNAVESKSTGTTKTSRGGNEVGIAAVVVSDGTAITGKSWTNSYTERENIGVELGQAWSMELMFADRIISSGSPATHETTLSWTGARDGVKSVIGIFHEEGDAEIIQTKTATVTASSQIVVTFDATATSGNDIVLLVGHGSDGITTPTGYTLVKTQEHTTNNQWLGIYRKKSNGTETGVTVNFAGSEEGGVTMLEVTGMATSPDDKTNGSYNASSTTSIDPGSTGTLSQADELALVMAWNWNGYEPWEIDDGFSQFMVDAGSSYLALIGFQFVTTTTALDPTVTFDGVDGAWSIAAIATFKLDSGTQYDETGRSVSITATVAATDALTRVETGRSVSITASVAATDVATRDEAGRTVSIAASVAATDALTLGELGRSVSISSSVAATDRADFTDVGEPSVWVWLTPIATDQWDATDDVAVSVDATVTGTDQADFTEALTVSVTASVAGTDSKGVAEDLLVTITSSVAATDVWTADSMNLSESVLYFVEIPTGTNYDETGRVVTVTSSVAATDQWDATDDLTVAIAATITGTDSHGFYELALAVSIDATVAATDLRTLTDEDVSVSVSSSVTATDQFDATDALTVAITSSIAATDQLTRGELGRLVAISSSVAATDTMDALEAPSIDIAATVAATDNYQQPGAYEENVSVAVFATVAATDTADFTDAVVVAVTAGVTATDELATSEALAVAITADVQATDDHNLKYIENVSVSISSSVIATDSQNAVESGSVAVVASVASTDLISSAEALAVAVTATVDCTDDHNIVYTENVAVAISATVAATDDITNDYSEDVAVAILSAVTAADTADFTESADLNPGTMVVNIVATVVATDSRGLTESAVVAITSSVAGTDDWTQYENLLVAITSSVASTDVFTLGEILSIEIISAVVATDAGAFVDASVVPVQSTVGSWDNWYMLLSGATAGVGTTAEDQHPAYIGSDGELGRSPTEQSRGRVTS